jgi:hypothetical protein
VVFTADAFVEIDPHRVEQRSVHARKLNLAATLTRPAAHAVPSIMIGSSETCVETLYSAAARRPIIGIGPTATTSTPSRFPSFQNEAADAR